jgi:hypothetical protein
MRVRALAKNRGFRDGSSLAGLSRRHLHRRRPRQPRRRRCCRPHRRRMRVLQRLVLTARGPERVEARPAGPAPARSRSAAAATSGGAPAPAAYRDRRCARRACAPQSLAGSARLRSRARVGDPAALEATSHQPRPPSRWSLRRRQVWRLEPSWQSGRVSGAPHSDHAPAPRIQQDGQMFSASGGLASRA